MTLSNASSQDQVLKREQKLTQGQKLELARVPFRYLALTFQLSCLHWQWWPHIHGLNPTAVFMFCFVFLKINVYTSSRFVRQNAKQPLHLKVDFWGCQILRYYHSTERRKYKKSPKSHQGQGGASAKKQVRPGSEVSSLPQQKMFSSVFILYFPLRPVWIFGEN